MEPSADWPRPRGRGAGAARGGGASRRAEPPGSEPDSGHDDGQHPRGPAAAAPRRQPQLCRPRHPHPPCARRGPGGLPGHAGGAAPSRGAAGRARCLGPPARGPG
uniref:p16/INK4A cyclin-dependent kinase inhibitor n=1 Tax=Canis lupus familiaris TaxID=9615 RepID=K7YET6_CANLF|nr:p16/INK4A cyclin-dependent kinase inhibitor [Canis lupus familiaris]